MEDFKTILYPIALTGISHKVVPYVVTMAQKFDADVHLVHVLRRFDWFVDTYVTEPPEPDFKRIASNFESHVLAQAQQKLAAFQQKHFGGIRIANAVVVSGTHYKRILAYADAEKIDLIIMGSGTTVPRMMFGSVAEKVSRLAGVPVMLIKSD
ncbi:MAG: universal stress protein [Desulfobacteraceae bacterium]|jgi:nucleotide-binding universal stress UspA family protein